MAAMMASDVPSCFAAGELDLDFGFFGPADNTGPDMALLSSAVAAELGCAPAAPPCESTEWAVAPAKMLTPPDSPLSAAAAAQDEPPRPLKRLRLDEAAAAAAAVLSPPHTPCSHGEHVTESPASPSSAVASPSSSSPSTPSSWSPSPSSSSSLPSSGLPDSLAPSALRLLGALNSTDDGAASGGLYYAAAVRSLASSHGASVCTALDRSGLGLAHYAAAEGSTDALAALRSVSADVHSWIDLCDGRGGSTPLAWAVARRQRGAVTALLEMGASVSAGGAESALRIACAAHDASTLALLLRSHGVAPADVNAQDLHGQAPLHAACAADDHVTVELLLSAGAQASLRDKLGATPLISAVSHGAQRALDLLAKDRVALNTADRAGRTPLHWAAACGSVDMTAALFKAGAKLELRDRKGRTPLLTAAQQGHRAVVDFLLMRKACATAEDNEGWSLRRAAF